MSRATVNCLMCDNEVRADNYSRHLRKHVNDNPMPPDIAKRLEGTPLYYLRGKDKIIDGVPNKNHLVFCQACSTCPELAAEPTHRSKKPECFSEAGLKRCVKPRKHPVKPKAEKPKAAHDPSCLVSSDTMNEVRDYLEMESDEDETADELMVTLLRRLRSYCP